MRFSVSAVASLAMLALASFSCGGGETEVAEEPPEETTESPASEATEASEASETTAQGALLSEAALETVNDSEVAPSDSSPASAAGEDPQKNTEVLPPIRDAEDLEAAGSFAGDSPEELAEMAQPPAPEAAARVPDIIAESQQVNKGQGEGANMCGIAPDATLYGQPC